MAAGSPMEADYMIITKELKKYEAKVEGDQIVHYAITKDGERIRMPDKFKSMYTDAYLMIREASSEMPEVLGVPEGKYWIPVRTDLIKAVKKS